MAAPTERTCTLLVPQAPLFPHTFRLTAWLRTLLSLQPQESTGVTTSRMPFLNPQAR